MVEGPYKWEIENIQAHSSKVFVRGRVFLLTGTVNEENTVFSTVEEKYAAVHFFVNICSYFS